MFYVIRHPEAGVGLCPATALDHHRARGWLRVSEPRSEPSDFHLPDFADAPDLDAMAEAAAAAATAQPDAKPAKTTKESKA